MIAGSAASTFARGFDWYSQGIILRPGRLSSIVEVKRIEGPIFNSKEAAEQYGLQLCKDCIDKTALSLKPPGDGANVDLNGLTGRVKLNAWPNTSPEIVRDVTATWESFCVNRRATQGCKLSTGTALNVATVWLGYLCEVKS